MCVIACVYVYLCVNVFLCVSMYVFMCMFRRVNLIHVSPQLSFDENSQ